MKILTVLFSIALLALMLRFAVGAILFISALFLGAFSFVLLPIIIFIIIIGGLILGLLIIGKLLGALTRAIG